MAGAANARPVVVAHIRSLPDLWRLFAPLVLAIGVSLALLVGVYLSLSRHAIRYDIGSDPVPVTTGVYGGERYGDLSYVYTSGDAAFDLAQTGAGRFAVRLRIGAPLSPDPLAVPASLSSGVSSVALGTVTPPRVYHLLLPAAPQGDIRFHLLSGTTRIGDDPRPLGLLLDRLEARALEPLTPPRSLLLSIPLALALLWAGLIRLEIAYRRKVLLLLAASGLLGLVALLRHADPPATIHPWTLVVPSLFLSLAIGLRRFEGPRVATPLRDVIALFVGWRLAIWIVAALGMWYSSSLYRVGEALSDWGRVIERQDMLARLLLHTWRQWDGDHYIEIARDGYTFYGDRWPRIVWFPLYPLLIRLLAWPVGGSEVLIALLISHVAFFAALLGLYELLARDFDRSVAYRTLVILLAFPVSFYFGTAYTESLALALTVAALWALRRQRWWLAGAAGFFLALTRLPGVLIAPILALTYLQHHGWRWRALLRPPIAAVLLPPLGLGFFMLYQWWRFDEPFAFLIAQRNWEQSLSPPWAMPLRTLDLIRYSESDWPSKVFQLVTWAVFLGLSVLAGFRLPLVYGLIMLLLLPPFLINRSESLPRYVLLHIPAFVVLALLSRRRWVWGTMLSVMLILNALAVLLFVNAFWVG